MGRKIRPHDVQQLLPSSGVVEEVFLCKCAKCIEDDPDRTGAWKALKTFKTHNSKAVIPVAWPERGFFVPSARALKIPSPPCPAVGPSPEAPDSPQRPPESSSSFENFLQQQQGHDPPAFALTEEQEAQILDEDDESEDESEDDDSEDDESEDDSEDDESEDETEDDESEDDSEDDESERGKDPSSGRKRVIPPSDADGLLLPYIGLTRTDATYRSYGN